ncbi:MAG: hypothetical protein KF835_00435 [Xanthobacteraceae bacterium]|nr:hypothetical protein [Xanthobacteraceae bacterium]
MTSSDATSVFLQLDETPIELEHDGIVASNRELIHHTELIHAALALINAVLRSHKYEQGSDTLVVLRLLVRLFNATNATLKLGRAGYFQPAFSLIRDIVELEFLADLFTRDRGHLTQWIALDDTAREKQFKQVWIRTTLDDLDGLKEKKRAAVYKMLSKYAAHPSPHGFNIISPENLTKIGPFPSQIVLTALLQELAKHFQFALFHIIKLLMPLSDDTDPARIHFTKVLIEWRRLYDNLLRA